MATGENRIDAVVNEQILIALRDTIQKAVDIIFTNPAMEGYLKRRASNNYRPAEIVHPLDLVASYLIDWAAEQPIKVVHDVLTAFLNNTLPRKPNSTATTPTGVLCEYIGYPKVEITEYSVPEVAFGLVTRMLGLAPVSNIYDPRFAGIIQ